MSLSPSTTAPQLATRSSAQLHDLEKYRQTVYLNDAGHHIAESRRRSRKVPKVDPTTTAYLDWVLYPTNDAPSSPNNRSDDVSLDHPTLVSSSGNAGLATHVTSAKRASTVRPKTVVIIEARPSIEIVPDIMKPSLQRSAVLTPPPTPRLDRLPTPDLSDFDEGPFCNCGAEAHIIRFCTSCNKASCLRLM